MDFPPEIQWLRLGHSVGGDARPACSSREDRLAGLLAGIVAAEAKLATLEKAAAAAVVPAQAASASHMEPPAIANKLAGCPQSVLETELVAECAALEARLAALEGC